MCGAFPQSIFIIIDGDVIEMLTNRYLIGKLLMSTQYTMRDYSQVMHASDTRNDADDGWSDSTCTAQHTHTNTRQLDVGTPVAFGVCHLI